MDDILQRRGSQYARHFQAGPRLVPQSGWVLWMLWARDMFMWAVRDHLSIVSFLTTRKTMRPGVVGDSD
jgi:hypothetical protein